MFRIIRQALRIFIGIVTYIFALYFLVAELNKFLDFCPLTYTEALANMKYIPFKDIIKVYFQDYFNMLYPVGVLAASTELFGIIRFVFRGLKDEIDYEFSHGKYSVVRYYSDGSKHVIDQGDDGYKGALLVIFGRFFLLWLYIPIIFWIKPFLLLINTIKLLKLIVGFSRRNAGTSEA